MNLSKHFTLRELTRSNTAERNGIDNIPNEEALCALGALCLNVLEPLRVKLDKVISVSSGYRSPEVNALTQGSSPTSQHVRGEAADFESFGVDNMTLAKMIVAMDLPYDELILEYYRAGDVNSGWVHCSHRRNLPNRKRAMTAVRNAAGKVVYGVL